MSVPIKIEIKIPPRVVNIKEDSLCKGSSPASGLRKCRVNIVAWRRIIIMTIEQITHAALSINTYNTPKLVVHMKHSHEMTFGIPLVFQAGNL